MEKRFVIESRDCAGESSYWNGFNWTRISSDIRVMAQDEVDFTLTHLDGRHVVTVIDWVERGKRFSIWCAAHDAVIRAVGYDDLPRDDPRRRDARIRARLAGDAAVCAAGFAAA